MGLPIRDLRIPPPTMIGAGCRVSPVLIDPDGTTYDVPLSSLPVRNAQPLAKAYLPPQKNPIRAARRLPYGFVPGVAPLYHDANDPETVHRSLLKRALGPVPESKRQTMCQLQAFVRTWCKTNLQPLERHTSFEDWLETRDYTMGRKDELRRAMRQLGGLMPNRKQLRRVASFIKREPFTREEKEARSINARCDAVKVTVGPIVADMEEQIYKVQKNGKYIFAKKIPIEKLPEAIDALKADGATYRRSDHKRFEAHMVKEVQEAVEFVVYKYMLRNYPEYAKILIMALSRSHGRTNCGIEFDVLNRRMSGDMVTSLGNGLTNYLVWEFLAQRNGAITQGYVEGDDGIFATYQGPSPTAEQYEECGFEIDLEVVDDPCEGKFCGLLYAGACIKDPIDFLIKFGYTTQCVQAGEKKMYELLRAKALSTIATLPQCPVIRAVADRALRESEGYTPDFRDDRQYGRKLDYENLKAFAPSNRTREFFARRFGLSVDAQVNAEARIRRGDDLGFLRELFAFPELSYRVWSCYLEQG